MISTTKIRNVGVAAILGAATLLVACAHQTPRELVDARAAYDRASHGPSKEYTPAELHVARESLGRAEQAFADDGDTILVRDQAYIAQRKAELAEASARLEMSKRGIAVADHEKDVSVAKDAARTRSELAATRQALTTQKAASAASDKDLADERTRRAEAEQRAARASADLARLAAVKQEARGTVITLSGSVLFASNKYTLLPAAQVKLGQVAEALLQGDPGDSFVVEGHTDSQGKPVSNQELSVNRANAVRQELIAHGIAADRISAEGHGAERSITDNKTAEGRANNRRVEIVIKAGAPR